MPVETRQSESVTSGGIGTGMYLAKIISHLDASFMGGLEVTLLKDDGNVIGESSQTYPVKYASPFFGNTAFEFMGYNTADFDDTQKSYGMWFVPPDVGVTVLVAFVDGRTDQGYWFGCVPGRFINHMVPGIATSEVTIPPTGQEETYDVGSLPSAEINRRSNDLGESLAIEKIPRAMHPIADRFLEQGLLEDDIRGTTTASSRRNVPSQVFGISTPGPLDYAGKRNYIGASDSPTESPVPVSRLGGTQFVMDDGDQRYNRATNASEGGPEYVEAPEGESRIPKDELLRFRTRTGHQILMHNSEDLIYIGNARGTTWIELTSDGKIDIFAEDSISIHTKQDFNFYADRDINMEAGRNFNLKVAERHQTEVGGDKICIVNGNVAIQVDGIQDETIIGAHTQSFGSTWDVTVGDQTNITIGGGLDINTTGDNKLTSGGNMEIGAANTTISGGSINLNGPAAAEAGSATPAVPPEPLSTFEKVIVDPAQADWVGDRYDPGSTVTSIMTRIPMHEPWPEHENLDPLSYKPDLTDREA